MRAPREVADCRARAFVLAIGEGSSSPKDINIGGRTGSLRRRPDRYARHTVEMP